MEVPVYVFTGFLEAGKTRFIQETLEDKRFNAGEKTLLLLCEEGVEEYDPTRFSSPQVYVQTVEEETELIASNMTAWLKKNGCRRVIVEYNGMWQLASLFQNLPKNWVIYQEFFFADATTFLQYNTNMRSLVVDKLNTCELVVFNRYTDAIDKMALHRIVRGISRRTDIAYESPGGEVAYDDIEDPLPFDVNAPVIEIADEDYALWYRDMGENLDTYDGKTVHFKGMVAHNRQLPADAFVIGRDVMTCCVEDITFAGMVAQWQGAIALGQKDWVTVVAEIRMQEHKLYGRRGPVLKITKLEKAVPPDQPVATFY